MSKVVQRLSRMVADMKFTRSQIVGQAPSSTDPALHVMIDLILNQIVMVFPIPICG
jgi:hypothetical protein